MIQAPTTHTLTLTLDFNIKVVGRTYSYNGCSDIFYEAQNEHEAFLKYSESGYDSDSDYEVDESDFFFEGLQLGLQWESTIPNWAKEMYDREGIQLLENGNFLIPYEEDVNDAINDLTEFIKDKLTT